MQLDKTAIVITQRNSTDLVDLSLLVLRTYGGPIALFALLGILPFAVVDLVLLWPLTQYDFLLMSSREFGDTRVFHFRFLCIVTSLILVQAPLALSGVTYFIGQAVFIERPSVREVFAAVWSRMPAMVFILGILRMSLLAFIPMVMMFMDSVVRPEIEVVVYLLCMCGSVYLIRGFRPFAAEILLLERCPLRATKATQGHLVYAARSRSLHSSLSNELFGVHIGTTFAEVLVAISLILGAMFAVGVLTGVWSWGLWMDLLLYPAIVWFIATWGTIMRFLSYMNSRILLEGWEIELRLKAEAQRLEERTL